MGKNTSIIISATDRFSSAINSMRNSGKSFNKDLEETQRHIQALQTRQSALGDNYKKLQVNLDAAKNTLGDAKKAFKSLNDEANQANLEKAYGEYNKAKEELKAYGDEIKETQRKIRDLSDEQSRANNRVSNGSGGNTLQGSLAKAGLTKMAGDALSNSVNVAIGSAFGDAMGSAISTTLSGAMSGAAMGSMLGPLGTIAGAAIGTVIGGIDAYTQNFAKEDEAFKSVRNDMVQNALQQQTAGFSRGMTSYSSWEAGERQLGVRLGDADRAKAFNDTLIEGRRTPPFSYETTLALSLQKLGSGVAEDDILVRIDALADTAAALGLDSVSTIVTQLESISMSDKFNPRILQTLMKSGIDPYQAIADNFKLNDEWHERDDLVELLKDPKIMEQMVGGENFAEDFIEAIYSYLGSEFAGAVDAMAQTFDGMAGILDSYHEDVDAAMAEGFQRRREEGILAEIDHLSGENGAKMQEANRMIGEWHAHLENEKERLQRKYMDEALDSDDYQKALAEDNGVEMGRILAQAQIEAQAAYNASEGAQLKAASERRLVNDVSQILARDKTYWNAGYLMEQEMSKGRLSALLNNSSGAAGGIATRGYVDRDGYVNPIQSRDAPRRAGTRNYVDRDGYAIPAPSRAMGVPYVPHDNYIIRAHQGERLLTAAEARSPQGGGAPPPNITGNNFYIREEADIYKVAQEIVAQMRIARVIS